MGIRRLHILGLTALATLVMTLAACTRSASTPPSTGGTGTSSTPLSASAGTMEAVRSALLTQTAVAAQGGAVTSTPQPLATLTTSIGTPAATVVGTTAPQVTPFPSPTAGRPATYTLHEGEFPYCLARRFNVNPDDLLAANGLSNDSLVVPGQTLSIPGGSTFPGPRALLSHPTNYTVKGGDTVYFIACAFGDVDPMAIAAANAISSPYTLTPGKVLKIP